MKEGDAVFQSTLSPPCNRDSTDGVTRQR